MCVQNVCAAGRQTATFAALVQPPQPIAPLRPTCFHSEEQEHTTNINYIMPTRRAYSVRLLYTQRKYTTYNKKLKRQRLDRATWQ